MEMATGRWWWVSMSLRIQLEVVLDPNVGTRRGVGQGVNVRYVALS